MRLAAIFLLMFTLAQAGQVNQLELALIGPIKHEFTSVPNKPSFANIGSSPLEISEDQTLSPAFAFLDQGSLEILAKARMDLKLAPLEEKQFQLSTYEITEGQLNCNISLTLASNKYVDARMYGVCFPNDLQPRFFYHERRMKIGQLQFIDTPVMGIILQLTE